MADGSKIEWTEATWSPLVGCSKVSPGCDNCYAENLVNRFAGTSAAFPTRFDTVSMRPERFLTLPLRWRRPRRIFVNSLSDLFHADVPVEFIARVFAVMALAPQHTLQLLTKRHGRMRSLLSSGAFEAEVRDVARSMKYGDGRSNPRMDDRNYQTWPLPNVWLGVSVEDQHWADIRIPALLDTPAAVRWISAEPLLGPLTFRWATWQPLGGVTDHLDGLRRLDWVVVGGESGKGARPMHPQWARDLRDQCSEAGVPFLFKQWGALVTEEQSPQDITLPSTSYRLLGDDGPSFWRVGKKAAGRELDGRTHDGYPQALS